MPTFKKNPLAAHGLLYNDEYMDAVWAGFRVQMEEEGMVFARLSGALKLCPACNLYFAQGRAGQEYCRPACRQAAYERRTSHDSATAAERAFVTRLEEPDDLDDTFPLVPPGSEYPRERPKNR